MSLISASVVAQCKDGQVIALSEQSGLLFWGSPDAMIELDFGGSVLTTMNNKSIYLTKEGGFVVNRYYEQMTATWQEHEVKLLNAEDFDIVEAGDGVFKLTDKVIDYSI